MAAAMLASALFAALPDTAVGASVFVVNRTGDAGDLSPGNGKCDSSTKPRKQCTLRAAIQEANALAGADTINFAIGAASTVITPTSPLPAITKRVTINGYSQPGSSANTLAVGNDALLKIVLDGTNSGATANGLDIQANRVTIKGLVIQNWRGRGVWITGNSNVVRGNFIGTDSTGTEPAPNFGGVVIAGGDWQRHWWPRSRRTKCDLRKRWNRRRNRRRKRPRSIRELHRND